MGNRGSHRTVLVLVAAMAAACSGGQPSSGTPPSQPAAVPAPKTGSEKAAASAPAPKLQTELSEDIQQDLLKPFTGDLDRMVMRRIVRIGVTFNRTFYFVDKGVQRGVSYDYGQLCEERLNLRFNPGKHASSKIHVFFVPLPRDMLLSALLDGKVDFVAAQLTMTPEREQLVAFTNPTRENVNQIVVTGAGTPPIASIADLSGREIFVRGSSPYRESLVALNQRFLTEKRQAIIIRDAPDDLEDDDLLEMVNAGLIPAIVVDDYIAKFWKQVFKNIVVNQEATVRTDGALAIAVRKSNPQLAAALNTFMSNYGLGTAFGNIIERKYLVKTTYVKSAASEAERRKFLKLVNFFRKYSDRYDMDFLLMAAQGYQESQLNQNAKSAVGAVGIMQLMPATGKEMNVGDVKQTEANIHAGVKYMRHLRDEYYGDEPMDRLNKGLFTFASYNAGPGRIAQLRRETAARGLNPNVWFGNVEQIASERIGRETVTYVSNIYKYYVAYRLVMEDAQRRNAIKEKLAKKD